ncbi:2-oxo-hepta-3-ene-1,7-dioic acid hydratase [Brucella anthropi]|uniref:2-oxo-hepta-3-ene-1,7-dioic acid hydratase n=1 Tax=Brucella anthropi TaxID=529 RepID=A0A6I0DKB1_BRUAN|nr:2-oxo-hepta-3-ene-1,7-dioic acid hydratase [Brucella anthropi]KAB2790320.1 2-oxo-hepta-3-ene-1,7-dioic acid hydratase [Brucella anthropi]
MTIQQEQVRELGRELFDAEADRRQIQGISARFPELTLGGAYRVQSEFLAAKMAAGRRRRGWKIGLTSRAMQRQLNIATPDSGMLLDDMFFDNGATIPAGRFIAPRIEAEIAFVMKDGLSGDVAPWDVVRATEAICPSLEILDTRIVRFDPATGWTRTVVDTIADNAANAGIILGVPRKIESIDLRWIGAIVARNGTVEETGLGAGVLGDPLLGICWLARRLAETGECIAAGDVLLSGSFVRAIDALSGSTFHADFGPFGAVSCYFE